MLLALVTFDDAFQEVAALVVAAAILGAVAVRLRQPLIVAFIVAGVLVGPSVLDVVRAEDEIHLLAELGVALVLFVVGLRLDLRLIRETGRVAVVAGAVQLAVTAALGFALALAAGVGTTASVYVALALAFSSTIIAVKLLSDRREIDELHGRIAVGILIVQDIVVIGVIIVLTALGGERSGVADVIAVVGKGLGLVAGVAVLTRFGLTAALHRVARTPELLMLASMAWGIGLAATADQLGFSIEVGAFLAGVALASTPYREAIGGRLVPLRDFLLLFFFLDLGASLDIGSLGGDLATAVVLSGFVLVIKPLAVTVAAVRLGYTSRVGFLAGTSIGQISEFSLIVAALGMSLGTLDSGEVSLITAVALITISASTYGALFARAAHARLGRQFAFLERLARGPLVDATEMAGEPVDVIVCGAGRFGGELLDPLHDAGHRLLVVDFDPRVVAQAVADGHQARYGDLEDPELPASLPLDTARWVVCTVRSRELGLGLLHSLEHHGYRGSVFLTAHHPEDADELRARGAHHVLRPYEAAASQAIEALIRS